MTSFTYSLAVFRKKLVASDQMSITKMVVGFVGALYLSEGGNTSPHTEGDLIVGEYVRGTMCRGKSVQIPCSIRRRSKQTNACVSV